MSLTSNSLNPILSGSTVTLTCTVELSPAVDVPVSVNILWTEPSKKSVTALATRNQESLTLYRSESFLNLVDSADSGQYTCTITAFSGVRVSASINIEIGMIHVCIAMHRTATVIMTVHVYRRVKITFGIIIQLTKCFNSD